MISLYDILEAANGQLFGEPVAQIFTDFCLDAHRAKKSTLFVARRTEQGDTHQYIEEAIRNGASGVMCSTPPECDTEGVSVIITRDTEGALVAWTHLVLGKLGTKVIGVTGTYGKSITVEAIRRVLSIHYDVHAGTSDVDGPAGMALSLARLKPNHRFTVVKLGATQPGEMAEMVQAIQPEVGVISHIGYAHTDRFEDLDQVALEKGVLINYLSPGGLAVLNYDDDRVLELGSNTRARVLSVGMERFGADLMAFGVVVGLNGTGFDLRYDSERYVGRWVPLLGKHQLYSVLAALVVGLNYEVPLGDALKELTVLSPLPGRMNPLVGTGGSLLIDDTYRANPQSTLAALDWVAAARGDDQRVVFVMGEMGGLGNYSQLGYRMIGQRAAEIADVIVTEGTGAAQIGRSALDNGMERRFIHTTHSPQDTVAALKNSIQLHEHDIVLVKGDPDARMEQVVQELLEEASDHEQLVRQDLSRDIRVVARPTRTTWVDIDMGALATNVRAIKKIVDNDVMLMAVVKADAYGHGAVRTSQTALLNGAEYLGVSSMSEALELRQAGIDAPILILGYTPPWALHQAVRQKITITLYDIDMAQSYERAMREVSGTLNVHVKVDTGMGRLGVLPENAVSLFRRLMTLQNLVIEGIYTHFSMADEDPEYTEEQLEVFKGVVRPLRASGFDFKYIHSANSAATLTTPDSHFNMVRVGLALYGLHPSETVQLSDEFLPVMSWKSIVASVKTLPAGHPVGYGNAYITQREERVAIVPVGYADGFRRGPENWGEVLIHGQYAEVLGRISMEKTAVRVTHIPTVSVNDEVVLLGRQGDNAITAEDVARRLGTINYEVVCNALPRVPRTL